VCSPTSVTSSRPVPSRAVNPVPYTGLRTGRGAPGSGARAPDISRTAVHHRCGAATSRRGHGTAPAARGPTACTAPVPAPRGSSSRPWRTGLPAPAPGGGPGKNRVPHGARRPRGTPGSADAPARRLVHGAHVHQVRRPAVSVAAPGRCRGRAAYRVRRRPGGGPRTGAGPDARRPRRRRPGPGPAFRCPPPITPVAALFGKPHPRSPNNEPAGPARPPERPPPLLRGPSRAGSGVPPQARASVHTRSPHAAPPPAPPRHRTPHPPRARRAAARHSPGRNAYPDPPLRCGAGPEGSLLTTVRPPPGRASGPFSP
jgi:hypothetical protein